MYKNGCVAFLLFPLVVSNGIPAAEAATRADDVLATVRVVTDRASYSPGERIVVTIHNDLAIFIYAPSDPSSCSIVSVQRLEGGKWVPKDPCVTSAPSDPHSVIAIPPRSRTWGMVGDVGRGPKRQDPMVSDPVKPLAAKKILREPPTSEPRKQDEPTPEIPEGGRRPPFSALDAPLEPGRYRVKFTFTIGAIKGPIETVYSNEFTMSG